ncbi:hypothetical protein V1227_34525 [Lentzea sp. DG1S-22]|uniref:hypothetical protein n=1 Tax=Lentzea sp. DG1S-22 TaxID=3108822 RepID=UPI002E779292|nr:hypothetical protein [Lentzea sp. DG1S-22]WVH80083.1 hypothetical protein V1227_34525 [Lentzea sp. DG1S-22]
MRKTITALSLVAALVTASAVPAASSSPAAPEVPAACAALVHDFADKLKKAVSSLAPTPDVAAVTPLIGDLLGLVTAMQNAGCLPTPPVSAPGAPAPARTAEQTAPADQCLPAVLDLIAAVAALGGTILGAGATPPDAAKVTELMNAVLKAAKELLGKCGLPVPPGGLPASPGAPVPAEKG